MRFLILGLALFASVAAENMVDKNTGEEFPKEVTFTQNGKTYNLTGTGVATRKKFFVKVYSIASYIQNGAKAGSDKYATLLQDDLAKQLTLKWVHVADAKRVVEGYNESFKNVLSDADFSRLKGEIDHFVQFFNHDIREGEEQVLRWLPGGDVEVLINGKSLGHIQDPAFAKGLWNIWFGPKSVVDRNQLTALF